MAVLERLRMSANQRFDLEDLLALQASMRSDSHYKTRRFFSENHYVLKGFTISDSFLGQASAEISMANSTLIKGDNTSDFSWFTAEDGAANLEIPSGSGGLQEGRNYIELKLTETTGVPLQRAFWDESANAGAGAEFTNVVDTITFIEPEVLINQSAFDSGNVDKIPLAIIDVLSGVIAGIQDKRPLFFRLGTPDSPLAGYSWASRTEPTITLVFSGVAGTFTEGEIVTFSSGATATVVVGGTTTIEVYLPSSVNFEPGNSVTGGSSGASGTLASYYESFSGGDKDLGDFKATLNSIFNEFKELKGTDTWYETGNVISLSRLLRYINAQITPVSAGAKFYWNGSQLSITDDATSGQASSDVIAAIRTLGDSDALTLTRQDGTGGSAAIGISDGDVLYIELPDVGTGRTYSEAGSGSTNFKVAARASFSPTDANFVLAYREGTRIIFKGLGEIEPGETIYVGDQISEEIISYIGANSDADSDPNYSSTTTLEQGESLTDGMGGLDLELDALINRLRIRRAANTSRIIIEPAEVDTRDGDDSFSDIHGIYMNFAGAQVDLDDGNVYTYAGGGTGDTVAFVTPSASQYLWYSIGLKIDTVLSNKATVSVFVNAGAGNSVAANAVLPSFTANQQKRLGFVQVVRDAGDTVTTIHAVKNLIIADSAHTDLSNLRNTAINTSLIPAGSYDLGSTSGYWSTGYINNIISNSNLNLTAGSGALNVVLTPGGAGKTTTTRPLEVSGGSSYVKIPSLTTLQRDNLTASNGMIIYNSDLGRFEGYKNGAWNELGGGGESGINFVSNGDSESGDSGYTASGVTVTVDDSSSRLDGNSSWKLVSSTAGGYVDFDLDTILDAFDNQQAALTGLAKPTSLASGSTWDIGLWNSTDSEWTISPSSLSATSLYPIALLGSLGDVSDKTYKVRIINTAGTPASDTIYLDRLKVSPDLPVIGESVAEKIRAGYYIGSADSIANGTYDIVNFDTSRYDTGHTSDTVTTGASWKFTAPRDGIYHVSANLLLSATAYTAGELRAIGIYKNGAQYAQGSYKEWEASITEIVGLEVSRDVELAAGDYIDIRVYQNSGAAITTDTGEDSSVSVHEVTDHKETRFGCNSDVEVVWNTSTSTSSDTTSFASGGSNLSANSGVLVPAYGGSGTSSISKRVQFSRPYKYVKAYYYTTGWVQLGDTSRTFKTNDAGTAYYGIQVGPVSGSSTQYDLIFYGSGPYPGASWSTDNSNGRKIVLVGSDNPIGIGVPTATAERSGTVYLNKTQTKNLTSSISTASTNIFTFNNLTVGKRYRLHWKFNISHTNTTTSIGLININHNSVAVRRLGASSTGHGADYSGTYYFTAVATSVSFDTPSIWADAAINPTSSGVTQSWASITECNNDVETTDFT